MSKLCRDGDSLAFFSHRRCFRCDLNNDHRVQPEPSDEVHEITSQPLRFDVKFLAQLIEGVLYRRSGCKRVPHGGAVLVDDHAEFGFRVQQHGFVTDRRSQNIGDDCNAQSE